MNLGEHMESAPITSTESTSPSSAYPGPPFPCSRLWPPSSYEALRSLSNLATAGKFGAPVEYGACTIAVCRRQEHVRVDRVSDAVTEAFVASIMRGPLLLSFLVTFRQIG
jgi:hypothetical protein